jgi:plastocyanin
MSGNRARATSRLIALVAAAALTLSGCGGGATAATPASGDPPGPSVAIAARDLAFDTTSLEVPANAPFTIVFENAEAVPHNVSIDRLQGSDGGRVFEGAVFNGPATRWYAVPALAPGVYTFLCQVHPSMTGRLVAA